MRADPPRRRLHHMVYHGIHPDEHARIAETVAKFNSHVLVHLGVWEPDARAAPRAAATLTDRAATAIARLSGSGAIAPTSDWGRTVAAIGHTAAEVGGSPSHRGSRLAYRPRPQLSVRRPHTRPRLRGAALRGLADNGRMRDLLGITPDTAPVGAFMQRIGGLLDHPDQVAGALAAGQVVIMGGRTRRTSPRGGARRSRTDRQRTGRWRPGVSGGHDVEPDRPQRPPRYRSCAALASKATRTARRTGTRGSGRS